MNAINKLSQNARTTEVGSITTSFVGEFNKVNLASDAHLTAVFTNLEATNTKFTGSICRSKAESELDIWDVERDNQVRAVYYITTGFMFSENTSIREAATKVDAVFEKYGMNIINQSYASESTLINSMIKDFAEPDIAAAIGVVPGLSQIVEELKSSQAEFETSQLVYQEEKSKQGNEENATTIKKTLLSIINDEIVTHLNAMVNVDKEKYSNFAATIAQIIDDMNVVIKKRKKAVEKGSEEDGMDENKS